MELISGFLLGFLGSFHCIGMCGPIAIALGSGNLTMRFIYNLGRILTYFIFGLSFGFFGSRLEIWGLQQTLSLFIGMIILTVILMPKAFKNKVINFVGFNKIVMVSGYVIRTHKGVSRNLILGSLNGFLPCPFVYLAVAGSLSLGDTSSSGLFMLSFGLGTIPAMLGVNAVYKIIKLKMKHIVPRRLYPAITFIIALLFILRGLDLGIPYISPEYKNKNVSDEIICH
ncbi:MAG: sulfite exporter TauE/SafE family protein [Ignavibacteria bacterium]|nr:sulfite exporter TauE/SafE family protein [Ignavibacteria bacterium]